MRVHAVIGLIIVILMAFGAGYSYGSVRASEVFKDHLRAAVGGKVRIMVHPDGRVAFDPTESRVKTVCEGCHSGKLR